MQSRSGGERREIAERLIDSSGTFRLNWSLVVEEHINIILRVKGRKFASNETARFRPVSLYCCFRKFWLIQCMPGYNNLHSLHWILGMRTVEILDKRKMKEIVCPRIDLILDKQNFEKSLEKTACSNSLAKKLNFVCITWLELGQLLQIISIAALPHRWRLHYCLEVIATLKLQMLFYQNSLFTLQL